MSERYKPKDLVREARAKWNDPNWLRSQELRVRIASQPAQSLVSSSVLRCRLHNLPWTDCPHCSKRKAKP